MFKNNIKAIQEAVDNLESARINLETGLRMSQRPTEEQVRALDEELTALNVILAKTWVLHGEMKKSQLKEEVAVK